MEKYEEKGDFLEKNRLKYEKKDDFLRYPRASGEGKP